MFLFWKHTRVRKTVCNFFILFIFFKTKKTESLCCFFHYFVVSVTEKYNHDQAKTREDKTKFSLSTMFAKIHEHHHTKIYKKRKASQCRYKFPMLPMKRTRILEPITSVHDSINENFLSLQSTLEKKHYDKLTSHEDFLDEF